MLTFSDPKSSEDEIRAYKTNTYPRTPAPELAHTSIQRPEPPPPASKHITTAFANRQTVTPHIHSCVQARKQ